MHDFRRTKKWVIAVFILALVIPTKILVDRIVDPPFERWLASRHEDKRQAFQEEVTQRRAERKETDKDIVKTPHGSHVEPVDTTDGTSTGSTHVEKLPQNSSDPPSRLLPDGPYKGMTPEEVQALETKQRDHIQRKTKYLEKYYATWDSYFQNSDDRKSLMLSVFKNLSPEQLELLREETLKILPAEDVNYFFADVKNKGTTKTDEQLIAEGERILTSDKVLENIFIELEIEEEQLEQEYKELFGE